MKHKNLRSTKKISNNKAKPTQKSITDTADKDGMYPIHLAILNNDLGSLEVLINNGADINKYNRDKDTPLLLAVKDNNAQIVTRLLEEGASLKRLDADQKSPLEVAMGLDHQECIDILREHEASQATNSVTGSRDNSSEFVTELIKLLNVEIVITTNTQGAALLTEKVLLLLRQYLNLEEISKAAAATLRTDIIYRLDQFIEFMLSSAKISNKDLLNLARKIIVIIQACKQSLPKTVEWNLSRIESLIEEKIVLSNVDSQKASAQVFVPSNSIKKELLELKGTEEDWYTKNGYMNFNDFIRINRSGAGSVRFLKFSDVRKEKLLQKTNDRGTETIELVTLKPSTLTITEEFLVFLPSISKRIKEEERLLGDTSYSKRSYELLDKAQRGTKLSKDEESQLEKVLRPSKHNNIHLVHFHHTNQYEDFWNDLAKEAFLTGATLHLFNPPAQAIKADFIYSGIAIVNKLLDEGVHPDKIILQSYGNGHSISKEVKNQFHKRGVELTQINYQHSLFAPTTYPEFICNHRTLHIYSNTPSTHKAQTETKQSKEFSKFANYIAKGLDKINYDAGAQGLTAAVSETHSLPQLINSFITITQTFLQQYIGYQNPALPDERVESIVGAADVA
jgi:hypothetical protein